MSWAGCDRSKQASGGQPLDWEIDPKRLTFYKLPGSEALDRLGAGAYGQVLHPPCYPALLEQGHLQGQSVRSCPQSLYGDGWMSRAREGPSYA